MRSLSSSRVLFTKFGVNNEQKKSKLTGNMCRLQKLFLHFCLQDIQTSMSSTKPAKNEAASDNKLLTDERNMKHELIWVRNCYIIKKSL